MRKISPSPLRHVTTSLKVLAVATVLGTVVLAAERHLAGRLSPEEIVTTDKAVGQVASPPSTRTPATPAQPAADDDYFPSHFPEPSGEPAEQPPTF